jgi:hypothetical protein
MFNFFLDILVKNRLKNRFFNKKKYIIYFLSRLTIEILGKPDDSLFRDFFSIKIVRANDTLFASFIFLKEIGPCKGLSDWADIVLFFMYI